MAVPKRQVQWTGADRACKVSHGHHLTIQECCIVGVDSCSEEQLSLSSKGDLGLGNDNSIGLMFGKIQDREEIASEIWNMKYSMEFK